MPIPNKNVVVDAYFLNNLGDDLFLDILINRYPNTIFHFLTDNFNNIQNFRNNERVKLISTTKLLININKYDAYVTIGGSLFQQENYWKKKWLNKYIKTSLFKIFGKKVVFMGFNFGPYQDEKYLNSYKKIFKKADFVSVRDKESYDLLAMDSSSVYLYPDIAFSLPYDESNFKKEIVGISIMDFGPNHENKEYKKFMNETIETLISKNKQIKIFGFQNDSFINDYSVIKEVTDSFSQENIEIILYENNLKEFLSEYSSCRYFITTRFHSMILSLIYKQTLISINYSDKVINTLNYLNLKISTIDCERKNDIESLVTVLLNNPTLSESNSEKIKKAKNESEKHFELLDKILD
ncbi:polysaccharide pyruvyl transferase family protein [Carnobacterium divergens]|uniref:polysaccharide pyruvyl transferase family protein n=1 Tax=Carnobacterium divergens TaxID=2748 RepID=UPI0039B0CE7F